jgi:arylsulfatase A-like enzyme
MDAHFPCAPPAPYADAFPGRDSRFTQAWYLKLRPEVLTGKRQVTAAEHRHLDSQYDGALLYMDAQLGRLFARMRELGVYDNTLIVVTSDHGEAHGEKNYFEHAGEAVYQFLVGVPLIIRYPQGARRGAVEEPVSLVDVMPTALDTLGYRPPAGLDGYSLLGPAPPGARVLSEMFPGTETEKLGGRYTRRQRAYYSGAMKFIQGTDGSRELYNLYEDPNEERDLYPAGHDVSRTLEANLKGWLARFEPRPGVRPASAMRYDVDRLRSLGYVQ